MNQQGQQQTQKLPCKPDGLTHPPSQMPRGAAVLDTSMGWGEEMGVGGQSRRWLSRQRRVWGSPCDWEFVSMMATLSYI